MEENDFNPFQDRQSRDIRNTLSTAFVSSVKELSPDKFEAVGKSLQEQPLTDSKKFYIVDRLERYKKCLDHFIRHPETTPLQKSLFLWDEKLFFEVHEMLEGIWLKAQGREKVALQGLIRAAGVYILMEGGRRKGIEKTAAKALKALEDNIDIFPDFPFPQLLFAKLKAIDPIPPKLLK